MASELPGHSSFPLAAAKINVIQEDVRPPPEQCVQCLPMFKKDVQLGTGAKKGIRVIRGMEKCLSAKCVYLSVTEVTANRYLS